MIKIEDTSKVESQQIKKPNRKYSKSNSKI